MDPEISLRDRFALTAMQCMLASDAAILSDNDDNDSETLWCHSCNHDMLSRRAYLIADAMLTERSRQK